jgi:TPR repeat protein/predicted phosphohydrolase
MKTRKTNILQIGGNTQINGITTYLLNVYERISQSFTFIFINTAFRESDKDIALKIEKLGGKIYHLPYKNNVADIEPQLKEIIVNEEIDVIHSHYFFSNGDFMRIASEMDVPIRISHCHNDKSKYMTNDEQHILEHSRELTERYATLKFANSEQSGRFFYGHYLFQTVDYLIGKGQFFEIAYKQLLFQKYNLDAKYKYSIFVGRFCFQKNTMFLIDIIKNTPDRKLLILGEGKEKERFISRIKAENIEDKFIFLDNTYNRNELYNLADSLLLPSLYEGFGIVLVEAQLAGLPCLASENVPQTANLGMVKYLPLEIIHWTESLQSINSFSKNRIDAKRFDNKVITNQIKEFYTCNNRLSELYINQGKEYMLGSERVFSNLEKVVGNFYKSAKLRNAKGWFYYDLQRFEGNGIEKNVRRANEDIIRWIPRIEKNANKNQPDYLVILGDMYSFGLGKPQSFETAFEYYLKAAELENLEAMCDLGYMYQVGQGCEKDLKKSFFWYKKSSDGGYLHSIRDLGQCCYFGLGTEQDFFKALECFEKASKMNYSHATTDLAFCYLDGKGVEQNSQKAAELLLLALKQGKGRTLRDLIAHDIDIDKLLNDNQIVYLNRTRIEKIDNNVLAENTVVVNKNIEYVRPQIFYDNITVQKFFVEKENPYYYAYGGVLYSKDKETLIRFPIGSPMREFEVPNHVKKLGDYCFQNCRNLVRIILHEEITSIGNSSFDDCKNLKKIEIPESIISIGDWAFHACDKIENIALSKNVKQIGTYAFGSCEKLASISVSPENPHYCSLNGDLYTKDLSRFLQYAIAKKWKQFVLPRKTKVIDFRAFSDALNLESVNTNRVTEINEKSFYWCRNLKEIILQSGCKINGNQVFDELSDNFQISYKSYGKTYLFADIHGHIRLDFLKEKLSNIELKSNDIVLILGDAGIVWSEPMNEEVKAFYVSLPCDVLFLDGNHENFYLLNRMEKIRKYGSVVHKVLDNVFHLSRGNSYLVNGYKYFVFGGAYSIKRDTNNSPVQFWKAEMPNEWEYQHGLGTLDKNKHSFDYILTHQAPKSILDKIQYHYSVNELPLLDYLDTIRNTARYDKWYFGHIHQDIEIGKFRGLYNEMEVIE